MVPVSYSSLYLAFSTCFSSNLLSFLLRCGTRPYEWGTQWDSTTTCHTCPTYTLQCFSLSIISNSLHKAKWFFFSLDVCMFLRSTNLSIYLSIERSILVTAFLCWTIYLCISLWVNSCMYICVYVCYCNLSIYLSIYPSNRFFMLKRLYMYLSMSKFLYVHMCVCILLQSIYLSIYLSRSNRFSIQRERCYHSSEKKVSFDGAFFFSTFLRCYIDSGSSLTKNKIEFFLWLTVKHLHEALDNQRSLLIVSMGYRLLL